MNIEFLFIFLSNSQLGGYFSRAINACGIDISKFYNREKEKEKKKELKTNFIRNLESKNKSNPKSPTLDFISVYKRRTKYKKDFSPIYIFVSLSLSLTLGFCFSVSNFSLVFTNLVILGVQTWTKSINWYLREEQ